jgi:phage shock protein A
LRRIAEDGRKRLTDLRRGLEMARAQDALRRAGANGRRALASGTGALREAEGTLAKIRELQARDEDVSAALDDLDRQGSSRDLAERLESAGFGANPRTKPADVLARMKAAVAGTANPEPSP